MATVLQAEADEDERVIDLEKYHLDCTDVGEADVMALIDNRRLSVVLNLTGCKRQENSYWKNGYDKQSSVAQNIDGRFQRRRSNK